MKSANLPFIGGGAAFVCALILFTIIEGPQRCSDGWASTSIGLGGACSHHGGVAFQVAFWLAVGCGIGGGFLIHRLQTQIWLDRKPKLKAKTLSVPIPHERATTAYPHSQPSLDGTIMFCGHCGSGMRAVRISSGQLPHGDFWECTKGSCNRLASRG